MGAPVELRMGPGGSELAAGAGPGALEYVGLGQVWDVSLQAREVRLQGAACERAVAGWWLGHRAQEGGGE